MRSVRTTAAPRAPAHSRANGVQVLREHRLQGRIARQHGVRAVAVLHRPAGFRVGGDPDRRALGKESQPLGPARQGSVEAAIALLQRREEPLVEHEPRAGHARDHPADDVAGRATGAGQHHRQDLVRPERLLERALVVLDEDSAHDGDAGGAESRGDRRAVGAG